MMTTQRSAIEALLHQAWPLANHKPQFNAQKVRFRLTTGKTLCFLGLSRPVGQGSLVLVLGHKQPTKPVSKKDWGELWSCNAAVLWNTVPKAQKVNCSSEEEVRLLEFTSIGFRGAYPVFFCSLKPRLERYPVLVSN